MVGRPYRAERDLDAVTRMWREVGWIDDGDRHAEALRDFLDVGVALVADVGRRAECLVHRSPGSIRYDTTDLPLCAVTAVTTSHVGRRQGLASALLVEALGAAAGEGAAVATLGMFDQGFYDRFGFGTSGYEHSITFDPSTLRVDVPARPPIRLDRSDADEIHALLVRRHRGHGSVVLHPPRLVSCELAWTDKPFNLGYRADDGRLTHVVLGSMKDEYGPYVVEVLASEEPHQLLELFGLLRSLGDQVATLTIRGEPAGVQVQDLVRTPLRQDRIVRHAAPLGASHHAMAVQQDRILDLTTCIAAVHLDVAGPEFGLRLRDPLDALAGEGWPGIGGEYTVRLGPASTVDAGLADGMPVLDATVNAFSRMWLGVRPATGLALTDDLAGPTGLLGDLDRAFRLPPPVAGWRY